MKRRWHFDLRVEYSGFIEAETKDEAEKKARDLQQLYGYNHFEGLGPEGMEVWDVDHDLGQEVDDKGRIINPK